MQPFLYIVVQEKLIGMGPKSQGIHFLGALVVDPYLDGVLGEHVALQEEIVVRLEDLRRA